MHFTDPIDAANSAIVEALLSTILSVSESIEFVSDQLRASIVQPFQSFTSIVSGWVSETVGGFIDKIYEVFKGATDYLSQGFTSFSESFTAGLSDVFKLFELIKEYIKQQSSSIIEAVTGIGEALAGAVSESLKSILEKLSDAYSGLKSSINWISEALRESAAMIYDFFTSIAVIFQQYIERFLKLFEVLLETVKSLFEIKPEEVAETVVAVQKALLGLR